MPTPTNNANDPWLPADPVPLTRAAVPIAVYRINGSSLEAMSSLRCVSITVREGPVPRSAVFRYAFDGLDTDSPQNFEQALSTAFTGPKVVNPGDRLAVRASKPDGSTEWIFDGYAFCFSGTLQGGQEGVSIGCLAREHRLWDSPIGGVLFRASDSVQSVADFITDGIIQFNPKGVPNASPSTADAGTGSFRYPSQMDPNKTGTDTNSIPYPQLFTLPMAVAHILFRFNSAQTYVNNPTRTTLDNLLVAREPITGTNYDPTNPSTYTKKDLQAPDTPMSDRSIPSAAYDLVKDYGFGMRFVLSDASGLPSTALEFFQKAAGTARHLYLQARGSTLDPAVTNIGMAEVSRDLTPVVNQWRVAGGLERYEASFILAPAFPSASTDGDTADHLKQWDTDEADPTAADGEKYREWILDEGADTHYANTSTTAVTATVASTR